MANWTFAEVVINSSTAMFGTSTSASYRIIGDQKGWNKVNGNGEAIENLIKWFGENGWDLVTVAESQVATRPVANSITTRWVFKKEI